MNGNRSLHSKVTRFLTTCLLSITLTGCGSPGVRVGTVSGPETELMKFVKIIAAQDYGLRIKIVEFENYRLLNTALSEGGLDANIFQHQSYLNEELKHKKYRLVALGETFFYPMGIYSYKFTHLKDIQKRSIVGIPSDPTNKARALRLLEKSGLIKLDIDAGLLATPKAVRYNPKELRLTVCDADQLASSLRQQFDVAVINANYAILADFDPSQHALFKEDRRTPYANLIVVREADKNKESLKQLLAAYQDEQVVDYAKTLFNHQVIPGNRGGEGGIRTRGRV